MQIISQYGFLSSGEKQYIVEGFVFDSFIEIENSDQYYQFNKDFLGEKNLENFLVLMSINDPNDYILIGRGKENRNQIFLYNNATGEEPKFICDNIFKLINERFEEW